MHVVVLPANKRTSVTKQMAFVNGRNQADSQVDREASPWCKTNRLQGIFKLFGTGKAQKGPSTQSLNPYPIRCQSRADHLRASRAFPISMRQKHLLPLYTLYGSYDGTMSFRPWNPSVISVECITLLAVHQYIHRFSEVKHLATDAHATHFLLSLPLYTLFIRHYPVDMLFKV